MEFIDYNKKYKDEINTIQQNQWGNGTDTDNIVQNLELYKIKLAVENERLIAVIVWHDEEEICFLDFVIVIPEFQSKGIGTRLMQFVLEDAKTNNKKAVECEAIEAKGKINAKKLLENSGFNKQYETKNYWGNHLPNYFCKECGCKPCICVMHKYRKNLV